MMGISGSNSVISGFTTNDLIRFVAEQCVIGPRKQ